MLRIIQENKLSKSHPNSTLVCRMSSKNALLIRLCVQRATTAEDHVKCWFCLCRISKLVSTGDRASKHDRWKIRCVPSRFASCCWKDHNLTTVRGMSYYRIWSKWHKHHCWPRGKQLGMCCYRKIMREMLGWCNVAWDKAVTGIGKYSTSLITTTNEVFYSFYGSSDSGSTVVGGVLLAKVF